MSALENAKTYTGKNLETIFFRPMLSGPSAIDLGVRVLYNMPVCLLYTSPSPRDCS